MSVFNLHGFIFYAGKVFSLRHVCKRIGHCF